MCQDLFFVGLIPTYATTIRTSTSGIAFTSVTSVSIYTYDYENREDNADTFLRFSALFYTKDEHQLISS